MSRKSQSRTSALKVQDVVIWEIGFSVKLCITAYPSLSIHPGSTSTGYRFSVDSEASLAAWTEHLSRSTNVSPSNALDVSSAALCPWYSVVLHLESFGVLGADTR